MSKVPLTAKGAAKLQEELKRLKSEERPRIIKAIAEAREHDGPTFIEFQIAEEGEDANVYPMVPSGAALHDMIRRPHRVDEEA